MRSGTNVPFLKTDWYNWYSDEISSCRCGNTFGLFPAFRTCAVLREDTGAVVYRRAGGVCVRGLAVVILLLGEALMAIGDKRVLFTVNLVQVAEQDFAVEVQVPEAAAKTIQSSPIIGAWVQEEIVKALDKIMRVTGREGQQ